VLILSGVKGDTRRYRTFHPYEQLRLAGVDCTLSHITDGQLLEQVARAGVVIFHRVTDDARFRAVLRAAERRGVLPLADVDDLVFDPAAFHWIHSPDFRDPLRAALYQEDMTRAGEALLACRGVIASTPFLAAQAEKLGRPAWVHRNAFSLEMLALGEAARSRKRGEDGRVIIGYASGTPTHDRDFAQVKPALQEVLRAHPRAELWLIGPLDPGGDWGAQAAQIKRHALVPWRALPALLAQLDINLAPLLIDNPFSQSKSEIKYVEAALALTPTIASPTQSYAYAIRPGENGELAAGEQAWRAALECWLAEADLRRRVAEAALADVLQRYHPVARAAELSNVLNQAGEQLCGHAFFAAAPVQDHRDFQPIPGAEEETHPSLARMALYSLRYRGLDVLLRQMWILARRWAARFWPYQ
jgi:glycosyltransferase involved in cell wall biosynthesis